jgi:hypothetical protein
MSKKSLAMRCLGRSGQVLFSKAYPGALAVINTDVGPICYFCQKLGFRTYDGKKP